MKSFNEQIVEDLATGLRQGGKDAVVEIGLGIVALHFGAHGSLPEDPGAVIAALDALEASPSPRLSVVGALNEAGKSPREKISQESSAPRTL